MQRAYKAATKASIDELEALEGRIAEREANGEEPSQTILWMRQRIIDNIEELGRNLKKFSVEGAQITADGQLESAILANEASGGLVETAAGRKPAGVTLGSSWTTLPDESLQAFVGFSGDGSPLGELFATIPQVTTDAMQMALVQGISLGEGPRTVARRVRKAADIGRSRAETIARTEMIRSAREAQRQLYTQNIAVQGYRRQATQDSRVCLACLALSGTLHATDQIMPSHPNCRCVMIPATMSWAEITGDSSIPDTRPEVSTPERILAGLSEAEKLAIMGPARFELYKNGKPLLDMVQVKDNQDWGPTTRVLPLKDIGGPLRFQPPQPPKVTDGVQGPKPVEVIKLPDNRNPELLLQKFRKIIGVNESQVEIESQWAEYQQRRLDYLSQFADKSKEEQSAVYDKWADDNYDLFEELLSKRTARNQVTDTQRQQMRDLLKSENPLKVKINNDDVNTSIITDRNLTKQQFSTLTKYVKDAVSYIDNRSVVNNQINLKGTVDNTLGGSYSFVTNTIRVHLNNVKTYSNNYKPYLGYTGDDTITAHEFIHWLDYRDDKLKKATMDFYEKRTAGDELTSMTLSNTKIKRDKWMAEYTGRAYQEESDGLYETEVNTVGMQLLLHDPLKFAETDFEHFQHIVKNVLGTGL
jgi:SPP1 gp7 family putative phage head morphogenesis protein